MMGQLLGNLLNVILDPIMILVFGWNIAGAAIATVIGNVVGAGYYIVYLHSGYVHSRCDLPRNRADLGAACGGCVVSAAGACTVHEELKKVDWQEIKKSLCRHPNWASAEALSYALKKLLYIVFAIRHPRRTFQQLLRRDFIELCKGNQIGGVGIAEAVLPRGNGLAADTQCFRHKLLRHLAADAVFLQRFAQGFGDSLLFLPHLLGINILFECLYDQNMETWKEKNLCWHQG